MKKYFSLLVLLNFVISCSKESSPKSESPDILGAWKVTEILIDSGDGSGTFEPYPEDWTLYFNTDGYVGTEFSLCDPTFHASEGTSYGFRYIADENRIVTNGCHDGDFMLTYHLNGDSLILHYPGDETRDYKFVRDE
jgi:hypothetical protein